MGQSLKDQEFERFAAAARPGLRGAAYQLCGDWHTAEDLAQVTLIRIYERWDHLTDHTQLGAYARQVLLRVHAGEVRRSRHRKEVRTAEWGEAEPSRSHPPRIEDRLLLQRALHRLGPRQREAVVLRYCADFSVRQAAEAMRCTPATVRSQTTRGLDTLRNLLTPVIRG